MLYEQDVLIPHIFCKYFRYFDWIDSPQESQFVIEDMQPVMVTDAGLSSHPIVVDVTDPNDINSVFDSISYSKVS